MKKIAIRLDTGKSIGLGHLIRCTALADAIIGLDVCEILFICRNRLNIPLKYPFLYLDREYKTAQGSYNFPSIIDEIPEMERLLWDEGIDCLIVDHYGAKDDYFYALRDKVKCFICIDDSLRRDIPVDVVVNGNIYGIDAYYAEIPLQLLGGQYTLMRSEFRGLPMKEIKPQVRNVYVTSGGADPVGFCSVISDALLGTFSELEVHVIVGNDFEDGYVERLKKKKLILHRHANMKNCMINADFYITGAGSTLYELAVCGVPSISYILAEDQEIIADYMHTVGTTYVCGVFKEFHRDKFILLCQRLFFSETQRKEMCRAGQTHISAIGAETVAKELSVVIDLAKKNESRRI